MARIKVLVVDDEPEVSKLIREGMEKAGFECLVAASAEEADRILSETEVDVVTLDLELPGRTGLEWLDHVRQRDASMPRKTIVVSGTEIEPSTLMRLTRSGTAVLRKPISLTKLVRHVQDVTRS